MKTDQTLKWINAIIKKSRRQNDVATALKGIELKIKYLEKSRKEEPLKLKNLYDSMFTLSEEEMDELVEGFTQKIEQLK